MKKLIFALCCLAAVLLLAGAASADTQPQPVSTIPYDQLPPVIEGQHHYLLLCVDQWTAKPTNLGNTDGIMLVTLDTRAHRVMLTTLSRDALVERPDGVIGRVTYIAANYSPEALCQVLSTHFGIRIEKYILFNFGQIRDIVDYFGGVDVTLTANEASYMKRNEVRPSPGEPIISRAGTYHLCGRTAVVYMRIRKGDNGGELMRSQRMRTVLSTLADMCREITYEKAQDLVNVIMSETTLSNMSLTDMLAAMEQAYTLRGCTIEELRLPVEGAYHGITYAGMSVKEIDWAMCRDSLNRYLQNSFLVLNSTADDEFGEFETFDDF
ncbi:MAG: LCP family protein [Clostridia bacterium]|nr:LCP family protein [Clostridia bacterium]